MSILNRAMANAGIASTKAKTNGQAHRESWHGLQADTNPKPQPGPVFETMSSVKMKSVTWLWPNRIPEGKLSILCGDPNLGKSTLAFDIAARVSQGRPFPDCQKVITPTTPGDVIIMSCEDAADDTIAPRLYAAEADLSRIHTLRARYHATPDFIDMIALSDGMRYMHEALEQKPETRLIIIDPLSAYMGTSDSHKDADVRRVLGPLSDFASKFNVAILGLLHLNKNAGTKANYRVMGSIAFGAAARAVWMCSADQNDPDRTLFLPIKNNLGHKVEGLAYRVVGRDTPVGSAGAIEWLDGDVSISADEALSEPKSTSARDEAMAWLTKRLTDGPVESKVIFAEAKELGFKEATLNRAKRDLEVMSRYIDFGELSKKCWITKERWPHYQVPTTTY